MSDQVGVSESTSAMTRPRMPVPEHLRHLPVDARGYPVPWFVGWIDGVPDFRVADSRKWDAAVGLARCWVCGKPRGRFGTFVVGPMCVVNRVSGDPPSCAACADFSARHCPFLSNPSRVRREGGLPEGADPNGSGGIMIRRNPGVCVLWETATIRVIGDGMGGRLLNFGEPHRAPRWFREGRPATRDEAKAAIETGCPAIEAVCESDRERALLTAARKRAELRYLPAASAA